MQCRMSTYRFGVFIHIGMSVLRGRIMNYGICKIYRRVSSSLRPKEPYDELGVL